MSRDWPCQEHTSVEAESCYLAFLFDLHLVGGILSRDWPRQEHTSVEAESCYLVFLLVARSVKKTLEEQLVY